MVLSRDTKMNYVSPRSSQLYFFHPNFEYKMVSLRLELESDLSCFSDS